MTRQAVTLNFLPEADLVSAIKKTQESNGASSGIDAREVSAAPEITIGQILKAKRLALGWSLEAASKKTAIAAAALHSIEEDALNMFVNKLAKLDNHIQIYANRLGVSLKPHEALIQKAKSSISPKDITPDLLDLIRNAQ